MAKKKSKTKRPNMLKPGQSLPKTVQIEKWATHFDMISDTFSLTVYWGAFGYRQVVSASAIQPLVELFESLERDGGKVYFNGRNGERELYFGQVPT